MRIRWGKEKSAAPRNRRSARWSDIRLWLGVVILIGSMFIGARVMATGEETVTLWRASSELAVGSPLSDLDAVVVALNGAQAPYLQGTTPPSGIVGRPIGVGEFIPIEAISALPPEDSRVVTVSVDPLHVPIGLNAGDQVDVWSSSQDTQSLTPPILVLSGLTIRQVANDVVGTGGEIGVVVSVPVAQVPDLVQAIRTGVIDLVKVPAQSQVVQ
ncbi:hypothetical protein N9R32_00050 [Actinomycetota bacterium]|nr:hypothetical protein [Actinomycetota bacterium]